MMWDGEKSECAAVETRSASRQMSVYLHPLGQSRRGMCCVRTAAILRPQAAAARRSGPPVSYPLQDAVSRPTIPLNVSLFRSRRPSRSCIDVPGSDPCQRGCTSRKTDSDPRRCISRRSGPKKLILLSIPRCLRAQHIESYRRDRCSTQLAEKHGWRCGVGRCTVTTQWA